MPDSPDSDLEMIERLGAASQIVDTLLWLKSVLIPNEWPLCDEFSGESFSKDFFSTDGTNHIRVAGDSTKVRLSNNINSGYAGIAGIAQSEDPWGSESLARLIILDSEGEKVYSPGDIRSLRRNNEYSALIIGETDTRFFVYIDNTTYDLDKVELYSTAGNDVFTPEILDLLNSLVIEEIFSM